MDDTVAAPLTETPSPDLFQTPNEQTPDTGTPAETSRFEKLKQAAKGVFEKHGVIYKRGGGRPRKDGAPNKLDTPLNVPATAIPANAAASAPVGDTALDSETVRKCCSAVIKGFSAWADRKLFKKGKKIGLDAKEINQVIADTAITEEEIKSFSTLTEICLRKYGVGTQYAPEIGLAAVVAGVGLRYAAAFKAFEPEKPEMPAADPALKVL